MFGAGSRIPRFRIWLPNKEQNHSVLVNNGLQDTYRVYHSPPVRVDVAQSWQAEFTVSVPVKLNSVWVCNVKYTRVCDVHGISVYQLSKAGRAAVLALRVLCGR